MAIHVYLSPHLDDAVLSCGGLIASQSAAGETVVVVTVCAGDPPPGPLSPFAQALHERWGVAASSGDRRSEDRMACGRLDASVVHLDVPDAIYRRGPDGESLYPSEEAILGPLHASEPGIVDTVAARIAAACPSEAAVYCPLAIGGHVDHRLTRLAAERLGRPLWYYCDFPYASRDRPLPSELPLPPGEEMVLPLSAEEVQTWASAIAEYHSQLSTFWADVYALYQEVREFHDRTGGVRLLAPLGRPQVAAARSAV